MRFQLIDRIDSWEPYRHITARKVVSAMEDHGSELILESVCQAASWLFVLSTQFERRGVLLSVAEVIADATVEPGEVLTLTASVTACMDAAVVVDGHAEVGGRSVLRATGIMCGLRAVAALDSPENLRQVAANLLRTEAARGDMWL